MFLRFVVRLNQASDFALRILMLLATKPEVKTVETIAEELNLVKSHVMKIVAKLTNAGLLLSQRGRNGGISLGKPTDAIAVGEVVRIIEADFAVVECMKEGKSTCTFAPSCRLKGVMQNARQAFLETLDEQSLADIVNPQVPKNVPIADVPVH